jgi:hypothetical protein
MEQSLKTTTFLFFALIILSDRLLDEFNGILSNQKLVELARILEQVNPKKKEATTIGASDVFEDMSCLTYPMIGVIYIVVKLYFYIHAMIC